MIIPFRMSITAIAASKRLETLEIILVPVTPINWTMRFEKRKAREENMILRMREVNVGRIP